MIQCLQHFPYREAPYTQELDALDGFGSPGERISLSFSIHAETPVPAIEISVSSLRGEEGVIDSGNLDPYVVKLCDQSGIGVYQSDICLKVPELLLKTDLKAIQDGYSKRILHWHHLLKPLRLYTPPDLRLIGNIKTSLQPGQYKQILINLNIPADAQAGDYTGSIIIKTSSKRDCLTVPLRVKVYPLRLLEAQKTFFIWYRGSLNWRFNPQHFVSETVFRKQLEDIHTCGFRSLSFKEPDFHLAQKYIRIAESIGFNGYVIFEPPYPMGSQHLKYSTLKPLFYVSDEMDVNGETQVQNHIRNSQAVLAHQGKTMASLIHQGFTSRLLDAADIGYLPNVLSLYLPQNRAYFHLHSEFQELWKNRTWYYWLIHMEKPNLHRVLAGVYLWKSKADGISPYCYQHLPQFPFSPYNDFDEWEPGFHVGEEKRPFRDHMATYPAKHGTVSTVQWEGLREGITDFRYLTTWQSCLEEASKRNDPVLTPLIQQARERMNQFMQTIDLKTIDILSDTQAAPYAQFQPESLHQFRKQLAEDIIEIENAQRVRTIAEAIL